MAAVADEVSVKEARTAVGKGRGGIGRGRQSADRAVEPRCRS